MATSLNYVPLCFSRRHKNVISLIFLVSNVFQKKIWTNTEKVCHKTIQNKRPTGPHIMHLSTMCHLFGESTRATILFFRSSEKYKLGRGSWDTCTASCQVSLNSVQPFQRRSRKNVSANQRPGRPSYFSDWPEKHKMGRGHLDLASYQVSMNSIQRFQRKSRKWLSQSVAMAAILFLRSTKKTQNW